MDPYFKDNMRKVKELEKENYTGMMDLTMKETFMKTNYMGMGNLFIRMENTMKENL